MVKFLRRDWKRHSKLGKGRKKKQKWKRPTGRDNKMREKRKGYPTTVSIGYRNESGKRNLVRERKPILVYNVRDLEKVGKDEIVIIGKVGKKKKIEIIKEAEKRKIEIYNKQNNLEKKK